MANRTERDFAPDPREMPRRRFMIAGEHVILRAFDREDAERCYRWMNDPNIVRTLNARYLCLYGTDRVRFPIADAYEAVYEEPEARVYRLKE